MTTLAALPFSAPLPLSLGMPGLTEWIIIGVLGLLFFGKRLPEVGRSLGKGIIEFKKGLKGIEEDLEVAETAEPAKRVPGDQMGVLPAATPTAGVAGPKFDPYTGKPVQPIYDPYTGKPVGEPNAAAQ